MTIYSRTNHLHKKKKKYCSNNYYKLRNAVKQQLVNILPRNSSNYASHIKLHINSCLSDFLMLSHANASDL